MNSPSYPLSHVWIIGGLTIPTISRFTLSSRWRSGNCCFMKFEASQVASVSRCFAHFMNHSSLTTPINNTSHSFSYKWRLAIDHNSSQLLKCEAMWVQQTWIFIMQTTKMCLLIRFSQSICHQFQFRYYKNKHTIPKTEFGISGQPLSNESKFFHKRLKQNI